jgi:N-acetylneuraminate synthase
MSLFVIAEIGINHNGDMEIAKQLIDVAADAGADAVKFQKRTIDLVYTKEFLDSARESPWGKTQRDQKRGLEFERDEYEEIGRYCAQKKIKWFASAWDIKSQKFLQQFNLEYNKIASAMIVDEALLREVASERKYTFISTGMCTLRDIDRAVDVFTKAGCPFELMHCVSTYPMADEDANLQRIVKLRERYRCKVGYSGHEVGLSISYAAVALSATSLERHITLSRAMYGSDQAASIEPAGFRQMVGAVRKIEQALGDGSLEMNPKEIPVAKKLRAHLAWESDSLEGTVYQSKRP